MSALTHTCVNMQTRHLLAARDGAAAEVSTGFGVDHGGNVFFRHQVCEELLTALVFFPAEHKHRLVDSLGHEASQTLHITNTQTRCQVLRYCTSVDLCFVCVEHFYHLW